MKRSGPPARHLPWVLAGLLLLIGVAHFTTWAQPDESVSSDDGAYVLAGRALQDGRWDVPFVASDVDPEGVTYPFAGVSSEGKHHPHVRRPAWVAAVAGGDVLGGAWGMRGLVLVLAGAGIVATGAVGREAGPAARRTRTAALAAAVLLLSPLTYHAMQLWAHAATVPLLAVTYLSVAKALGGRPSAGWTSAGGVAAAAAVSLHVSALPFAVAAGAVAGGRAVVRRSVGLLWCAAAVGGGAVAGHLVSSLLAGRIVSAASALGSRSGGRGDRLDGILDTLVTNPSFNGSATAKLLGIAAFVVVGAAVVAARVGRPSLGAKLLVVSGACWVVRMAVDADAMATGLSVGWPLLLLAGVRPWSRWSPVERDLLAIAVLGTLVVVATQYDIGGGLNWGGRFLLGGLPLLAVLVAAALDDVLDSASGRALSIAALALAAVVTAASLRADATIRERHALVSSAAVAASTEVVVTSNRLLPRRSWRTADDVAWLVVASAEDGGIERTEEVLRSIGVTTFTGLQLSADHYQHWTGRDPATQPRDGVVIELDP